MEPVIEVYRVDEDWHPYPWRFAITHDGKRHKYAGIPNQCATKRSAAIRAWWRVRWLKDGTYSSRYQTVYLGGNRSGQPVSVYE